MKRRVATATDASPASTKRLSALAAVAKEFRESFRPAAEVLTRVRAVPTIFPGLDHATRVGGFPIERLTLVHGPSGEGKTKLTIGLIKSFLARDHFGVLIDAERTTPRTWLETVMGDYMHHPGFLADRPETYEGTVKKVREFVNKLEKLRDKGKIPDETSALLVVDSIRKLVPEDIFKRITAEAARPGDKERVGRDRAAQIKAAMNSSWMDELIPLLEKTKTAMVIIARETDDPDASVMDRRFGTDFKVGGGSALYYDASLVLRVELQRHVTKDKAGTVIGKPVIYGQRHRVTIRKSKVAGQEDRQTVWYFHDSSGLLVPEGFDRARDIVELGKRFGVIQGEGWLKWRSNKWQGEHAAVKKLAENPAALEALEAAVREKFVNVNPTEVTGDGEVVDG